MGKFSNKWLSLLALIGASLAIVGCGGGSNSSSGQESTAAGKIPTGKRFKGSPEIVNFGKEASAAEREAASEVLKKSMEARESADFAGQCAALSLAGLKEVTGLESPRKAAKECPAYVWKLAQPLKATEAARADTMEESVDVLRVKGSSAYALYHGTDGKDYAVPLQKENGKWKVRSLISPELS